MLGNIRDETVSPLAGGRPSHGLPSMDLTQYRARIDQVDRELVALIAKRLDLCRDIAVLKKQSGIAMMQPGRVAEVKETNAARGEALGLSRGFTIDLYERIIEEACRIEDAIIGDG